MSWKLDQFFHASLNRINVLLFARKLRYSTHSRWMFLKYLWLSVAYNPRRSRRHNSHPKLSRVLFALTEHCQGGGEGWLTLFFQSLECSKTFGGDCIVCIHITRPYNLLKKLFWGEKSCLSYDFNKFEFTPFYSLVSTSTTGIWRFFSRELC